MEREIKYETDVQRRLAEVLKELRIRYRYSAMSAYFTLTEERKVIYEDIEFVADVDLKNDSEDKYLQIHSDGALTYSDGETAFIKYCKTCNRFYFGRKAAKGEKETCVKCGASGVKYVSNNGRIPGWYGRQNVRIIDEEEAKKHLENASNYMKDEIAKCIHKLSGEARFITVDEGKMQKIQALKQKFPNMTEVIDYILMNLSSCEMRLHKDIQFKPIVLVGGPGCGKTTFVSELCEILLGKRAIKIDLGNDIADFTLTGTDPGYHHANYGRIVEAMFDNDEGGPLKNPIIHFDELDKINKKATYSVETVFYSILERNTARRFFDCFVGVNVDASGINYIFTANTLETVPAPIINRMRVFQIADYTHTQLKESVIDSFYNNWLSYNDMEREYLPEVLSDVIKERILAKSNDDPRSIDEAISAVFAETSVYDEEVHHKIALFSPEEMYSGWKKFRGRKEISKIPWKLGGNFLPKETKKKALLFDEAVSF